MDLGAALREGVASLELAGVEYAIVGSVAASVWGLLRSTRDIDVVVTVQRSAMSAWLEKIDPAVFYVLTESAREAIATGGSFNLIHLVGGAKIDIFVTRFGDQRTASMLSRRTRAQLFGVDCWVASVEDVVLAKLAWRLQSRSERQWVDCGELVSAQSVDREYLRREAGPLGVEPDLEALLAEVDLASSGDRTGE